MRVTYDPSVQAGYIYLIDTVDAGFVKQSVPVTECDGNIVLDFDADGRLIGIEVLDPALLHPELRRRAD
jgi:uncharacterized protein YuzE